MAGCLVIATDKAARYSSFEASRIGCVVRVPTLSPEGCTFNFGKPLGEYAAPVTLCIDYIKLDSSLDENVP